MKTVGYTVLMLFLIGFGCNEKIIPPPPMEETPRWNVVPELASLDVRYMIQRNGVLYLAAIDPAIRSTEVINDTTYYRGDRGVIYKTTDGITWTKIKGFKNDIGAMTFHGDTLYCLAYYYIWRLLPNGVWQTAFKTPPRLVDVSADGDMIFINDSLYAMQTVFGNAMETYRISPDGSYAEVPGPDGLYHYAGAKFIKTVRNGKETVYLRPPWYGWGFFQFDGYSYKHLENGLTEDELRSSPTNSMAIKDDTLFAGFGGYISPGAIKILIGNQWTQFRDTIPYSHSAYLISPILRTEPTAIIFVGERMFIATNSQGVMEWKGNEGWVRMSEGLKPGYIPDLQEPDLRHPLPFLEYFQGNLIAAYGKPGYGPWGEVGVYTCGLK
jgi:hypothetical protein